MLDPDLPDSAQIPNRDADRAHVTSDGSPPCASNAEDPYEGAVPPGYDWPTHGGYLGCLLGLLASCPIAFVASTFVPPLERYNGVPGWIARPLTVVVFLLIVFAVGRVGYVLGKRFLREYPHPNGKTWGEDDDYVDPATPEQAADPESAAHQKESEDSGRAAFLRPPD